MTVTVRQRIEDQGADLVGRDQERSILHHVLDEDGPMVVFVHGIGGVGKSTLVEAFAGEARARGAIVLLFDGGAIEPTSRGFIEAISTAIGGDLTTVEEVASRLTNLGERVVLVLDRYEVLRPLDLWLRQSFVPALSDDVRVVFAGRESPMIGWSTAFGRLFRNLPLGNLPRDDAETLLRQEGVDGDDLDRIHRLARGHPLSLRLAASALVAGTDQRPRGTDDHRDRRGADRALSGPTRSADPSRAGRVVRRPSADAVLDRRDVARQRAAGRVRASACPAVRGAEQRRSGHPRHRPRGRRGLPSGDGPGPFAPVSDRRVAAAPGRGHARNLARDVALHRGPALHPREPRRPRSLLPDVGAPVFRRTGAGDGLAGDPRDRHGFRAARSGGHARGLVETPARCVLCGP